MDTVPNLEAALVLDKYRDRVRSVQCPSCDAEVGQRCWDGFRSVGYNHEPRGSAYDAVREAQLVVESLRGHLEEIKSNLERAMRVAKLHKGHGEVRGLRTAIRHINEALDAL